MPFLLYCVTRPDQSVTIASGVCGAAVQSQELSQVRVYWSEIADIDPCLGTPDSLKKAALQFHQVLRDILSATIPIPFRFPTLVESQDAVQDLVAAEQQTYRAELERIGDAVQYEIVGSWTADEQADLATPVSGREYLKRRQEAAGRIAAIEDKLKTVTTGSVREWRVRQERKTHRWFALVPRENCQRFLHSLRSAPPSQGLHIRLSGPWPPTEFLSPTVHYG